MLVGEVRIATTGAGSSWKLSGASQLGLGGDEAVEEAPVQQRVAQRLAPAAPAGSRCSRRQRRRAERVGDRRRQRARAGSGAAPPTGELPQASRGLGARSQAAPDHRASDRRRQQPPRATWCARRSAASRDIAALGLRRGLPLEQVAPRHEQAPEGADDRVGRDPGLVGEEDDGERDLLERWSPRRGRPRRSRRARTCRAAGAAAPAGARRSRAPRSRRGRAASSAAASRAAASSPPTRKSSWAISTVLRRRLSRIFQRDSSDSRLGSGPSGPGTRRREPGQQLPVAPDPAVLAPGVGQVAGGVVVVDDDVGGQAGAGVAPLDQVVREQRVLGEAAVRRLLERVDVVDRPCR